MARKKKPIATWTTREGEKMAISTMEDRHLLNTIRYIEQYAKQMKATTTALKDIPLEAIAVQLVPQFADLVKEAKQRQKLLMSQEKIKEIASFLAELPYKDPLSASKKGRRGLVELRPIPARQKITRRIILRD